MLIVLLSFVFALEIQFPFQTLYQSLPGYEGHYTIQITYSIPDGTQSQYHPNPGERYKGCTRVAFLPDSPEGREVLMVIGFVNYFI